METGLFSRSGKHNPKVKWQKNIFRAGTVIFCSLLSWAGSSELDKFVSLIGAFAWYVCCAKSPEWKLTPFEAFPSASFTLPCFTSGGVQPLVDRSYSTASSSLLASLLASTPLSKLCAVFSPQVVGKPRDLESVRCRTYDEHCEAAGGGRTLRHQ